MQESNTSFSFPIYLFIVDRLQIFPQSSITFQLNFCMDGNVFLSLKWPYEITCKISFPPIAVEIFLHKCDETTVVYFLCPLKKYWIHVMLFWKFYMLVMLPPAVFEICFRNSSLDCSALGTGWANGPLDCGTARSHCSFLCFFFLVMQGRYWYGSPTWTGLLVSAFLFRDCSFLLVPMSFLSLPKCLPTWMASPPSLLHLFWPQSRPYFSFTLL